MVSKLKDVLAEQACLQFSFQESLKESIFKLLFLHQ